MIANPRQAARTKRRRRPLRTSLTVMTNPTAESTPRNGTNRIAQTNPAHSPARAQAPMAITAGMRRPIWVDVQRERHDPPGRCVALHRRRQEKQARGHEAHHADGEDEARFLIEAGRPGKRMKRERRREWRAGCRQQGERAAATWCGGRWRAGRDERSSWLAPPGTWARRNPAQLGLKLCRCQAAESEDAQWRAVPLHRGELVPELVLLGLEIAPRVLGRRNLDGDALADRQPVADDAGELAGVVAQEPDGAARQGPRACAR